MSESKPASGTSRPNAHAFAYSFAMAGVVLVGILIVLFMSLGAPGSGEALGRVIARFTTPLVLSAAITGYLARNSREAWSWWRYLLLVVAVGVGMSVVLTIARGEVAMPPPATVLLKP